MVSISCADLCKAACHGNGSPRLPLRPAHGCGYILDPADVKGPDYPSETFRVLKEKEIRQHGEYRTRRLVLEAWDRMEASGEFKALDL